MNAVRKFVKKEPVFTIAGVAAIISMFFITPDKEYLSYINYSVIILLFCLMLVVAGLMKTHLFDIISSKMLKISDSSRGVAVMLVNITFFSAMLITNDVALITLVPLTISLFSENHRGILISLIAMETVAANLGSMMMPFGNPQNLHLYSFYKMNPGHFIMTLLPFGLLSLVLVNITVFIIIKNEKVCTENKSASGIENKKNFFLYITLFIVCILTVLRLVNIFICFCAVIAVCLITDRRLLKKVDYNLLLTFIAFFVFVGNLSRVEIIKDKVSEFIDGREFMLGVIASQVISNVPASIMLSGFTQHADELLIGVNAGGLGTLVASLASLISYKFYVASKNSDIKKYLLVFTIINLIFLAALMILFLCIY